jgi:alpha-ketoglutarate-dependent taurine dioxygenase
MPAKRKVPPAWWLLGYLAQYQPKTLMQQLDAAGLSADQVYLAAHRAAEHLPSQDYRRLSKTWAVRQFRLRSEARYHR